MQLMVRTLTSHERKFPNLEDRSRWSNLIVFGTTKPPSETEALLRFKVIFGVFVKNPCASCTSNARIHRLGRTVGKRSAILFFQEFNEKEAVLWNSAKLKGSNISMQNDNSNYELHKRKPSGRVPGEDRKSVV